MIYLSIDDNGVATKSIEKPTKDPSDRWPVVIHVYTVISENGARTHTKLLDKDGAWVDAEDYQLPCRVRIP